MPIQNFEHYKPGQMPSAEDFNRLLVAIEGLSRLNGPGVIQSESGVAIRGPEPETLTVQLTGIDTTGPQPLYSWVEITHTLAGTGTSATLTRQAKPGGLKGGLTNGTVHLPLYEINKREVALERNGLTGEVIGPAFQIFQGDGPFYLFSAATSRFAVVRFTNPSAIDPAYNATRERYQLTDGYNGWVVEENVRLNSWNGLALVAQHRYLAYFLYRTSTIAYYVVLDPPAAQAGDGLTGPQQIVTAVSCVNDVLSVTTKTFTYSAGLLQQVA